MASSRYTAEQKTEALALYREHGPAEAERRCGIPRTTISAWAYRSGTRTDAPSATRAATEAARAVAANKRANWQLDAIDKLLIITGRIDGQYTDVLGTKDDVVHYTLEKPPAQAVRHFAAAIETLVKTLRLEQGETTSNTGHTIGEGFSLDAELESFTRGAAAAAGRPGGVAEHGTSRAASAG